MSHFEDLCAKHHCPKVRLPDNPLSHTYGPVYDQILERCQPRRILEIGLGLDGMFHADYQRAGSLLIWAEMFPEAEVYGLDIREDALRNEGNIRSFVCDQADALQLQQVASHIGGDFDLIVDDGSHEWEDQKLTAFMLAPMLSRRGVYVIEDVKRRESYADFPIPFRMYEASAESWDDRLIVFGGVA